MCMVSSCSVFLAASIQVHFSSQSLFDYLRGIQNDGAALAQFGDTLLSIFKDNLRNDRCTLMFCLLIDSLGWCVSHE